MVPELFPARFLPEARRQAGADKDHHAEAKEAPLRAVAAAEASAQAPAEVPAETLVAVPQPAGGPPASPPQRAAVVEIARRGGYSVATLERLARCVRQTMFERLDERGLHDVRAFLDSATGGRVSEEALAARITELQDAEESDPPARERLAAWLLEHEEAAAAAQAA